MDAEEKARNRHSHRLAELTHWTTASTGNCSHRINGLSCSSRHQRVLLATWLLTRRLPLGCWELSIRHGLLLAEQKTLEAAIIICQSLDMGPNQLHFMTSYYPNILMRLLLGCCWEFSR